VTRPAKRKRKAPAKRKRAPIKRKPAPKRQRARTRARAGTRKRRSDAAKKGWVTRRAKAAAKKEIRFRHDDPNWEPPGGWQGEEYYDEDPITFMTKEEIYEHYDMLADRLEVPISDIYRMAAGYEPLH